MPRCFLLLLSFLVVSTSWVQAQSPRRPLSGRNIVNDSQTNTPARPPAAAAAAAAKGRFCAILVGVDTYQDSGISPLQFCARDVRTLSDVLTKSCGYDRRDVYLLATDSDARPTRQRFLDRIKDVLDRAQPADVVLIYFSGHGWLDGEGKAYLLTEDCKLANVAESALPVSLLREALERSPAQNKCLLLDCCHAGGKDAKAFGVAAEEVGKLFQDAGSVLTFASCKAGERSWEWAARRQGLFTAFLAEGLAGEADASNDQRVSTLELAAYVTARVAGQARKMDLRQNPVLIVTGNNEVPQFDLALVPDRAIHTYSLPLINVPIGKLPPGWEGHPSLAVFRSPEGMAVYPQKPGNVTLSRKGLLLESGSYLEWSVYLGGWSAETSLTLEGKEGTESELFYVNRPGGNVGSIVAIDGLARQMIGDYQQFSHRCRVDIEDDVLKFSVNGDLIHTKRIPANSAYDGISIRLFTQDERHYAAKQNSSLLGLRFGRKEQR